MGGREVVLLVADVGQRTLTPLGPSSDGRVSISDSPAGAAFRSERVVAERRAGSVTLWLPLLDSSDRIGVLGVRVDDDTPVQRRRWEALAALLAELVVAKSAYGDGLALARRVRPTSLAAEMRWAMLPPLTFISPEVTVSGILEPAYEIAGDTFDYAVNGTTLHLAILDAMGHGLEASSMANLAVASYRHSRRSGFGLQETVTAMDEVISAQFGDAKFVTGQLATLDTGSGVFSMLNLGHPLPLLLRDGRVVRTLDCTPGLPAGLGGPPATVVQTTLEPGDFVLLHTDGFTEARDAAGVEFGQERFEHLVGDQARRAGRPAELLRKVASAVLEYQGHRPRDDATLLLAGWRIP